MKKCSLNEIDDDSSDDEMETKQMLEEFAKLEDAEEDDPDYVPLTESSANELSTDEVDTDEEKTESQRMLNGKVFKIKFPSSLGIFAIQFIIRLNILDKIGASETFTESPYSDIDTSRLSYSSDFDNREKSKRDADERSFSLDEHQFAELEKQLVMKIMKHFKDVYNYPPTNGGTEDIFYSPIGERVFILLFNSLD